MKKIFLVGLLALLPALASAQDYTVILSRSNADNLLSQIWQIEKGIAQQQIISELGAYVSNPGADPAPNGPGCVNPSLSFSSGADGHSINVSIPACTVFHVHGTYSGLLVSCDLQLVATGTITYDATNSRLVSSMTTSINIINQNGWLSFAEWLGVVNLPGNLSYDLGQLQFDLPKSVDPYGVTLVGLSYDAINQNIVVQLNSAIPSLTLAKSGAGTTSPPPGTYYGSTNLVVTAIPQGHPFVDWIGCVSGTANPVTVTMKGNQSLTANFVANEESEQSAGSIEKAIPGEFTLSANYPNPFNPTTVINYQLPKDGFVTLKVYDMLGREVATLVDNYQAAGYYEATFDGSKLSSGTYLYRMRFLGSDGEYYVSTKKALLTK